MQYKLSVFSLLFKLHFAFSAFFSALIPFATNNPCQHLLYWFLKKPFNAMFFLHFPIMHGGSSMLIMAWNVSVACRLKCVVLQWVVNGFVYGAGSNPAGSGGISWPSQRSSLVAFTGCLSTNYSTKYFILLHTHQIGIRYKSNLY